MIGKQMEGYPAVARFTSGHAYEIKFDDSYSIVRFEAVRRRYINKKTQSIYVFTLLADNLSSRHETGIVRIQGSNMDHYQVRELKIEDIPLFMDAPNIFPLLKETLAAGHLIVKEEHKSKSKPELR